MIIDIHCHAGHGDRLTAPWNTSAPLEQHLRRARAAGIDRTVVFAAFHSDYHAANREVAKIVAAQPGRLMGFAFVHPDRDRHRLAMMLEAAIGQWGFRGIKVHGSDGFPNRTLCDLAQRYGVPILVDVVGQAHTIDMFAREYPAVNFIIPHLGSFADDFRAHERVVEQIVRYPNVYTDTSGVRRFDYLVEAVRRGGVRKILFGSDGPWLHPGLELHKVRLLGLPGAAQAAILGGNATRLLGLEQSGTGSRVGAGAGSGLSAPAAASHGSGQRKLEPGESRGSRGGRLARA